MKLEEITISDYSELKHFFKQPRYRLCEYSLSSILAWTNDEYQPYGAVENDALIVAAEFKQRRELRHLMLPVSPEREYGPKELHRVATDLGFETFWFVPEAYLERYEKKELGKYFSISRLTSSARCFSAASAARS